MVETLKFELYKLETDKKNQVLIRVLNESDPRA
jgi:hypothetical protein